MRKNIVAGNWKMNLKREGALALVSEVLSQLPKDKDTEVVFAPCFLYLYKIAKMCNDFERVKVSAQNCSKEEKGAFTGEVSAEMVATSNGDYVIIGHSERRLHYQEKDHLLLMKLLAAASQNLKIIFCIGESSEEKESGKTLNVLKKQLEVASMVTNATILVAYEPIWAIGTGKSAEVGYIEEVHGKIREELECLEIKELLGLIYGGSVKANTAKKILSLDNVDGLLVGGASLKEKEFSRIALNSTIK